VAETGRALLLAGLALAGVGGALLFAARLGARRVPGTLVLSGRHVTFVFPILLCVIVSIVLTIVLAIFRR
jgi:DUF2905 family protein